MDTIATTKGFPSLHPPERVPDKTDFLSDFSSLRPEGIDIDGTLTSSYPDVLAPDTLRFVAALNRRFSTRRLELLQLRVTIQARIHSGAMPAMSPRTAHIREGIWAIDPVPADLLDRRVEITGPAGDTKMVINALNSGANVFMADFEDAQSPTWENTLRGQANLMDAVRKTISFTNAEGKKYHLNGHTSVLMVRPRGWHLVERHLLVDGKPVSASLFDFGIFFYHNAKALLANGSGPYFYLPKLENHLEARLWNDVFVYAQNELSIPRGTIKATVLIETILAAFEMDEILYELREHSAGLNCGRWDYIFSFIKKFHRHPSFVLPDRAQVTMDKGFLSTYVRLLIRTCHRRGAHAMGGMAAQIPINNDESANAAAIAKVRADKEREVREGHDGTWVAHPGLVSVAKEVFISGFNGRNQLHVLPERAPIAAEDLLRAATGDVTEKGLRTNIDVAIQYIEAWLRGVGAVPLYNLMEDAATAEISRAQVWQWLHHGRKLDDGREVSLDLVKEFICEELGHIRERVGKERFQKGKFDLASKLFESLVTSVEFVEFLTLPAYEHLS